MQATPENFEPVESVMGHIKGSSLRPVYVKRHGGEHPYCSDIFRGPGGIRGIVRRGFDDCQVPDRAVPLCGSSGKSRMSYEMSAPDLPGYFDVQLMYHVLVRNLNIRTTKTSEQMMADYMQMPVQVLISDEDDQRVFLRDYSRRRVCDYLGKYFSPFAVFLGLEKRIPVPESHGIAIQPAGMIHPATGGRYVSRTGEKKKEHVAQSVTVLDFPCDAGDATAADVLVLILRLPGGLTMIPFAPTIIVTESGEEVPVLVASRTMGILRIMAHIDPSRFQRKRDGQLHGSLYIYSSIVPGEDGVGGVRRAGLSHMRRHTS